MRMMLRSKRIETFTDRFPLVGPIFWIVSLQFFIVQFIVAKAWRTPYNLANNPISDLGNTACGVYAGRLVCSPLHALMNTSFIVLGFTMVVGSLLIYHEFLVKRGSATGFGFMSLAGIGTIIVGIFAENTISSLHAFGATLPFVLGNLALLILGLSLDLPRNFRIYSVLSGIVALSAFILFSMSVYLGLGEGGMERIVAYPQTIWLIAFGIYMSRSHYLETKAKA